MLNKSAYDLSQYQIYFTREECVNDQTHSLAHVLASSGIDVNNVCVFINGGDKHDPSRVFPKKYLSVIAEKCGINIYLRYQAPKTGYVVKQSYPSGKWDKNLPVLRLALVGEYHYMLDVFMRKEGRKKITTGILAMRLFSEGFLNPVDRTSRIPTAIITRLDEKILLEQAPDNYRPKPLKNKDIPIWYADIECVTRPHHIPMMYGAYRAPHGDILTKNQNIASNTGKYHYVSCGADLDWRGLNDFLNKFPKGRNIIYFHNLKYDWNNIKSATCINIRSITKKDGEYYAVVFTFFGRVFELRDSYKFIPKKLAEFPEMFGLANKHKHEYIAYELYTVENTTKECYVSYREMRHDDVPAFIYTVTPEGLSKSALKDVVDECAIFVDEAFDRVISREDYIFVDGRIALDRKMLEMFPRYFQQGRYYHMAHCEYYLHSDCELLYLGMEAFRKMMLEALKIDCHEKLTLPSMVHERMCQLGCYQDVYKLSSNLRRIVDKAVYGGRVATKDNKMWDVQEPLDVIDGVSLYPSACYRICNPTREDITREEKVNSGLPAGPAKLLTTELWDTCWKQKKNILSFYIIQVNITAINIHQQIAFTNCSVDGKRIYTNDPVHMKGIWIDKITLEDWVEFQGIEFEFLQGIYWDGLGNTKLGEVILELFSKKQQASAEGNIPMSNIYKLALNSLYGKNLSRPPTTKTIVKDKDEAFDYLLENFDTGGTSEECANQMIMSFHREDTEFANRSHVGIYILAMARRIMNEVMDVANTNGIAVYKTDTDSLHPQRIGEILNNLYREKYGRNLIGKGMGQFAYELKFPGHTDIYSERAIVLGKKVYLHVVTGLNKDGVREKYYYCKMKGVNIFAMEEYPDKLELYSRLYAGEEITFDLTYGQAVMFQFKGKTTTREVYKKRISFSSEKGQVER